jgi:hypothetical protein
VIFFCGGMVRQGAAAGGGEDYFAGKDRGVVEGALVGAGGGV